MCPLHNMPEKLQQPLHFLHGVGFWETYQQLTKSCDLEVWCSDGSKLPKVQLSKLRVLGYTGNKVLCGRHGLKLRVVGEFWFLPWKSEWNLHSCRSCWGQRKGKDWSNFQTAGPPWTCISLSFWLIFCGPTLCFCWCWSHCCGSNYLPCSLTWGPQNVAAGDLNTGRDADKKNLRHKTRFPLLGQQIKIFTRNSDWKNSSFCCPCLISSRSKVFLVWSKSLLL